MLKITLRHTSDGWYWKSNNSGSGGVAYPTSAEAVAAALAAEALVSDTSAAWSQEQVRQSEARAAELRRLR